MSVDMSGLLEKTWTFLRSNVVTVSVVVVLTIGLLSMSNCRDDSMQVRLDSMAAAHAEEIQRFTEASAEERRRHDENIRRLREDLEQVARRHDEAIAALERRKAQQVESLVRKYEDDPVGVARQISAMTGFQMVMP